jgi:hypothetical protein
VARTERLVANPAGLQFASEHHDPAQAWRNGRQRRERLGEILADEGVDSEQRGDFGIGEEIGELLGFRPGAEWHDNHAERRRAETGFEPFQAVVDQQADALAAAKPGGAQCRGDPAGRGGEIAIGRGPLVKRAVVGRRHLKPEKLYRKRALASGSDLLDQRGRLATSCEPCLPCRSCSTSSG